MDDILVHSPNEQTHCIHLREVFERLRAAGLTLRGNKCHIGLSTVNYLGHVFSAAGMAPDPQKIYAVSQIPEPKDVTAVWALHHTIGGQVF